MAKEILKTASTDKSVQPSINQREGKQVAQTPSTPKRTKKQLRQDEASYVMIDKFVQQEASEVQPLKKFRRV